LRFRLLRRLYRLLPGFLSWPHVQKLPADQDRKRKRNSENKVSVVFHKPLKEIFEVRLHAPRSKSANLVAKPL
jgi:hypothetical protein